MGKFKCECGHVFETHGTFTEHFMKCTGENETAALRARVVYMEESATAASKLVKMIMLELPKTIGDVNIPLLMDDLAEVDRLLTTTD